MSRRRRVLECKGNGSMLMPYAQSRLFPADRLRLPGPSECGRGGRDVEVEGRQWRRALLGPAGAGRRADRRRGAEAQQFGTEAGSGRASRDRCDPASNQSDHQPAIVPYTRCVITAPDNEETFNAVNTVSAGLLIEPALQPGHRIEVLLDGSVVQDWPPDASTHTLKDLERGSSHAQRAGAGCQWRRGLLGADAQFPCAPAHAWRRRRSSTASPDCSAASRAGGIPP